MDADKFAHYLWHVRVGHSYALNHVANKIGISCKELGDIEHNRLAPTDDVLRALEKVYFMRPGALDEFKPRPDTAALRHSLIETLVDDYTFAVGYAGDLGGAELS